MAHVEPNCALRLWSVGRRGLRTQESQKPRSPSPRSSFKPRPPAFLFRWPSFSCLQATPSAAFLSPFSLRAQRLRATFSNLERRPSGTLPGPSRLLLCPVLRWLEALLPETKCLASLPLVQATLEGRERDDACRAACGTRQFFPKTDRARARSELGESQRGCRRGLEGASLSAGGASGSELIASGRASSGFAGRASFAANERGRSERSFP